LAEAALSEKGHVSAKKISAQQTWLVYKYDQGVGQAPLGEKLK